MDKRKGVNGETRGAANLNALREMHASTKGRRGKIWATGARVAVCVCAEPQACDLKITLVDE